MVKYKDLVFINTKWKKLMSTVAVKRHRLNMCYIPICKVCGKVLDDEYAIRNRTKAKRPKLTCIQCYKKTNTALPKKELKYNPYKIAYKGVLLWEQLTK